MRLLLGVALGDVSRDADQADQLQAIEEQLLSLTVAGEASHARETGRRLFGQGPRDDGVEPPRGARTRLRVPNLAQRADCPSSRARAPGLARAEWWRARGLTTDSCRQSPVLPGAANSHS